MVRKSFNWSELLPFLCEGVKFFSPSGTKYTKNPLLGTHVLFMFTGGSDPKNAGMS